MKLEYTTLDVEIRTVFDETTCEIICQVSAELPIFRHWGKTVFHKKAYSKKRTFSCKPKELETRIHGVLGVANWRYRKLMRRRQQSLELPTFESSVSTIWYLIDKVVDEKQSANERPDRRLIKMSEEDLGNVRSVVEKATGLKIEDLMKL